MNKIKINKKINQSIKIYTYLKFCTETSMIQCRVSYK